MKARLANECAAAISLRPPERGEWWLRLYAMASLCRMGSISRNHGKHRLRAYFDERAT